MHPAQKRSILAMLATAENTLAHVKSLLMSDFVAEYQEIKAPKKPESDEYLSDSEEEELDRLMETQRKQALVEHEQKMQRLHAITED